MHPMYVCLQVETIGDCYFVAGGLIHEDEDGMAAVRDGGGNEDPLHAERVFMFAKVGGSHGGTHTSLSDHPPTYRPNVLLPLTVRPSRPC